MKKLIFITLLPLMLFWHGIALANNAEWRKGADAYESGNYKEAFQIFKPLAEQGIAGVQFNIGLMYFNGQGVPRNYNEALKWYEKAAEQGNAGAQYSIGWMYQKGYGVPVSHIESAKWHRLAAEQGMAYSQYHLAELYRNGQGVEQNYKKAIDLFNSSADNGHDAEQVKGQLQDIKKEGFDALELKDYETAYKILKPLAENGDADAQYEIGTMYFSEGQGTPQDYEEAKEWFALAAEQGHAGALNNLGTMYGAGKGVARNYDEAERLFRLAIAQGNKKARRNLDIMNEKRNSASSESAGSEEPLTIVQDEKNEDDDFWNDPEFQRGLSIIINVAPFRKAFDILEPLAEQGNPFAQYYVGLYYGGEYRFRADIGIETGGFVTMDVEKFHYFTQLAFEKLLPLAEQGHVEAQTYIGKMYYGNAYTAKSVIAEDGEEAIKWFRKAAEQGFIHAQYELGEALRWRDGSFPVVKNENDADEIEGLEWLQKASDQGHIGALRSVYDYREQGLNDLELYNLYKDDPLKGLKCEAARKFTPEYADSAWFCQ